jgi:hypothetical protein
MENRWLARIIITAFSLMVVMFLMNSSSRDYSNETKSYLKSIGREDIIEKVVPKTPDVCK